MGSPPLYPGRSRRTATNKPGKAIKVGTGPGDIAITPNGKTVYVTNDYLGVVPIRTATNKVGKTLHMHRAD